MNSEKSITAADENKIVYVRSVKVDELPQNLRQQAQGRDEVYALHSTTGDRIALVKDRELAFVIARQNELAPVSLH